MDLGLDRITRVLDRLDRPQDKVPVIHLAGTNGKGSTVAYLGQMLRRGGRRVGQFTSPHFLEPRDAIRVDGVPVDSGRYEVLQAQVDAVKGGKELTSFERETVVAFLHFLEEGVEVAVVECGLGGELDATNVCSRPLLCILTAVSLDHQGHLGSTIPEIARVKVGIMRPGVPMLLAPQEDERVEGVVRGRAKDLGCPVHLVQDQEMDSPLGGRAQGRNVATALAALSLLPATLVEEDGGRIGEWLEGIRWPGRMDRQRLEPLRDPVLLDGAHNPAGARALREVVDEEGMGQPIGWILGMSEGKDVEGVLRELLRPGDQVMTLGFSTPEGMPWCRCVDPQRLAQQVKAEREGLVRQAMMEASKTVSTHRPVVCGSLYLLADVYRAFDLRAFPS
ncbi:MAG: Mur ligase [Piptocephalis tieghemiana]|nr:MAG: Mur ligase [Piptocephalis tieghemiana]